MKRKILIAGSIAVVCSVILIISAVSSEPEREAYNGFQRELETLSLNRMESFLAFMEPAENMSTEQFVQYVRESDTTAMLNVLHNNLTRHIDIIDSYGEQTGNLYVYPYYDLRETVFFEHLIWLCKDDSLTEGQKLRLEGYYNMADRRISWNRESIKHLSERVDNPKTRYDQYVDPSLTEFELKNRDWALMADCAADFLYDESVPEESKKWLRSCLEKDNYNEICKVEEGMGRGWLDNRML